MTPCPPYTAIAVKERAGMEITYRQVGDWLLPKIELDDTSKEPLTKYDPMRLRHLRQNDRVYYTVL